MESKGKFKLMTVEEFLVWLGLRSFSRKIEIIQNHHTYLPGYKQFTGSNHFTLLEGMEHFHMHDRGFSEIAQNITTFPDGKIAVCRPLDTIPAGIKGANAHGICIEHVGNFDQGGDTMTEAHREAIITLNAVLCAEFGITPSVNSIVYHHWYDLKTGKRENGEGSTKSCPGTAFFGGNTVDAARAIFIPLVEDALRRLP